MGKSFLTRLYEVYVENFLVLGFSVAVIFALSFPIPGSFLASIVVGDWDIRIIQFLNNAIVFFISGLSINLSDLKSVLVFPKALIYGIASINFITTLSAFIMIMLPYHTRDFAEGFTIFSSVPTTLGVGVSLTASAGGDQVLALFLTVITNLLGIVTIPSLLQLYLRGQVISFNPSSLIVTLTLAVLIPIVTGMIIRHFVTPVAAFMKKHKQLMSMLSNANLICIVWLALSNAREVIIRQNPLEIFLLIVTATIQHVFYLIFNYYLLQLLFLPLKQVIAVTIMSSQKSSPVALAVIVGLTQDPAKIGLLVIPCIIGQLVQIFIGSWIVKYFKRMIEKEDASKGDDDSPLPDSTTPALTDIERRAMTITTTNNNKDIMNHNTAEEGGGVSISQRSLVGLCGNERKRSDDEQQDVTFNYDLQYPSKNTANAY